MMKQFEIKFCVVAKVEAWSDEQIKDFLSLSVRKTLEGLGYIEECSCELESILEIPQE